MARRTQPQFGPNPQERKSEPRPATPTLLRIRLTPRGGRDAVMRYEAGVLYARVAAPPVDGAANRALLDLVASTLGLPKSKVEFHSGATSRDKVLRVDGITEQSLLARLQEVTGTVPNANPEENR